jgi:hypothetical protein
MRASSTSNRNCSTTRCSTKAHKKDAVATERNPQLIRLRAIAKRLIPFTARWNPDAASWKWEVNLLNSPTVNAFCMPGGRIAFYNGILTKLNLTDDEVAMVMGHEIAHALREHAREQAGKNTATSLVARIAGAAGAAYFGVDPRLGDAAAGVAAKGAALSYSRGDETEADLVGMDLAARAGFDPRAGIALVAEDGRGEQEPAAAFLSTHPAGKDRIAEMNKHMHLVLPVFARAKGLDPNKLPAYHSLALPAHMMSRPPLPMRDGVAPSYLYLPEGQWPDLITFLVPRAFPTWRKRRGASAWRAMRWWMATAMCWRRTARSSGACASSTTASWRRKRRSRLPKKSCSWTSTCWWSTSRTFLPMIPTGRFLHETLAGAPEEDPGRGGADADPPAGP